MGPGLLAVGHVRRHRLFWRRQRHRECIFGSSRKNIYLPTMEKWIVLATRLELDRRTVDYRLGDRNYGTSLSAYALGEHTTCQQ